MQQERQRRRKITNRDFAAIHCIALSALGNTGVSLDDLDDIKQELAIKLIRKAHLFRKSLQAWSTFRRIVLVRCMTDILNARNRPGIRRIFINSVPLDRPVHSSDGLESHDEEFSLVELVTADQMMTDGTEKPELPGVGLKIDMEDFVESLSPTRRRICRNLMTHSPGDTIKRLRMPKSSFYRHLNEIRKAMRIAELTVYV